MNIQTNDEKNTIPVTEDDAFSYDGYQVVRGEFFAHTYEPSFTFNSSKVSVNTACIKMRGAAPSKAAGYGFRADTRKPG